MLHVMNAAEKRVVLRKIKLEVEVEVVSEGFIDN